MILGACYSIWSLSCSYSRKFSDRDKHLAAGATSHEALSTERLCSHSSCQALGAWAPTSPAPTKNHWVFFSLLQEGTGYRFLTHSQSSAVLGQGLTEGFPAKWALVSLSFLFLPPLFQERWVLCLERSLPLLFHADPFRNPLPALMPKTYSLPPASWEGFSP